MKWLAAGGLVVIGLLVFLFLQLNKVGEPIVAEASVKSAAGVTPSTGTGTPQRPAAIPAKTAEAVAAAVDDGKPKKIDPQSDQFFQIVDELSFKRVSQAAAPCYEQMGTGVNRVSRNQHLKLTFDRVIKDGVVTIANVKKKEGSNLDRPEMEACMIKAISEVTMKDDSLPDGVWPDEAKITPERGLKKYMKDNVNYQGDGPIGKAVMKSKDDPGLKSDSATKTDHDRSEDERIEAGGLPEGMK